ncbi:hypothetical protein PM082_011509 [Marasmius tenuissimus]|nr:hypothetical protein PM082_011509 [Marasmius tenuissimus]
MSLLQHHGLNDTAGKKTLMYILVVKQLRQEDEILDLGKDVSKNFADCRLSSN